MHHPTSPQEFVQVFALPWHSSTENPFPKEGLEAGVGQLWFSCSILCLIFWMLGLVVMRSEWMNECINRLITKLFNHFFSCKRMDWRLLNAERLYATTYNVIIATKNRWEYICLRLNFTRSRVGLMELEVVPHWKSPKGQTKPRKCCLPISACYPRLNLHHTLHHHNYPKWQ